MKVRLALFLVCVLCLTPSLVLTPSTGPMFSSVAVADPPTGGGGDHGGGDCRDFCPEVPEGWCSEFDVCTWTLIIRPPGAELCYARNEITCAETCYICPPSGG